MFYRCKTFTSTMAPFTSRHCGPEWFKKPFSNPSPQEENGIHATVHACFNPTSLWSRLTSPKTRLRVAPYHPNLEARQFGLSQLPLKCFISEGNAFFFSTKKWLENCHYFCKRKEVFLGSFDYSLSYHCT